MTSSQLLIKRIFNVPRDLLAVLRGCKLEEPFPLIPWWVKRAAIAGAFVAVAATTAVFSRYILPTAPEQPIPFSHRFHVQTKKLECMFCHNTAAISSNAGMPSLDKCLLCHNIIAPKFWPIAIIHEYKAKEEPVPWKWVNKVPEYVRFSHQPHINVRIDCGECHGNIAGMDRVKAAHRFDMNFCITCHWRNGASDSCYICHY